MRPWRRGYSSCRTELEVQVSQSVSILTSVKLGNGLTNLDAIERPANQVKVSKGRTGRMFACCSLCVFCRVEECSLANNHRKAKDISCSLLKYWTSELTQETQHAAMQAKMALIAILYSRRKQHHLFRCGPCISAYHLPPQPPGG